MAHLQLTKRKTKATSELNTDLNEEGKKEKGQAEKTSREIDHRGCKKVVTVGMQRWRELFEERDEQRENK